MNASDFFGWVQYLAESGELARAVALTVVILIVTSIVSYVAVHLFDRAYSRATGETTGSIFDLIIRFVVWALGISFILKYCFSFDVTIIWGALGVGGVALSLGMQNTISNLLGGLQISFSKEINIGDWVVVGAVSGEVKDINARVTVVRDDLGQTHIIPNSVLNSTTVTRKPEFQRIPFTLCLSHKVALEQVQKDICTLADKSLSEKGMLYDGKNSVFVFSGSSAEGNVGTLVVYSYWKFATWQVQEAALPPVLAYLEKNDLMGHWQLASKPAS